MRADFDFVRAGKSVWEITCRKPRYTVKCEGKVVSEVTSKNANDHTGFTLHCGWSVHIDIRRLRVTGRLDPRWVRSALAGKGR